MQWIAIGSDSAGANLSVATNLRLRSLNELVLTAQLLNYGCYDRPRPESDSYVRCNGPKCRLTLDEVHFFQKNYIRDERDLDDPLVCPLHADKNRAMAKVLRNANIEVQECIYRGASDSFLEAVRIAATSDRVLDADACWLVRKLHREVEDSS